MTPEIQCHWNYFWRTREFEEGKVGVFYSGAFFEDTEQFTFEGGKRGSFKLLNSGFFDSEEQRNVVLVNSHVGADNQITSGGVPNLLTNGIRQSNSTASSNATVYQNEQESMFEDHHHRRRNCSVIIIVILIPVVLLLLIRTANVVLNTTPILIHILALSCKIVTSREVFHIKMSSHGGGVVISSETV